MKPAVSRYPRLFDRLYSRPLLLLPDRAYAIEQAFARFDPTMETIKAKAFAEDGGAASGGDYPITAGGVALLEVMGTLVQRSSWMDSLCGMTGYSAIGYQFALAEADPKVKGILLEIDSGGGEVNGCFDLVDQIAGSTKPVWAVANEAAYSAAYAIASAADRLFMPRTAGVGSIGVIALHVDQSSKDTKAGLKYTPIFAGDHKYDGNSHEPLPDAVRVAIQADIDRLYQIFTSTVAQNRGLSADAVIATQADVFHPAAAIDLGLADDTGTLDDAINQFEEFLASPTIAKTRRPGGIISLSNAVPAAPSIGVHMDPKDPAANTASITPEALATARNEAAAEATKTATVAGASAERARVASILASDEAKGRGELANHLALETDMSADAAIKLLAKSPKETPIVAASNAFVEAMAGTPNPKVTSDNGDAPAGDDPESTEAAAAAIAKFQRKPASASK